MRRRFVRAAKTIFAAADAFAGRWPGPRLLIYHQVGVDLGREMEVPEELFRGHLDWLAADGEIVDLDTALRRRAEPEASWLFSLGFDDGYRDLYEVAFPILEERGIPFSLYLTTGPVETQVPLTPGGRADPLSWQQVGDMLRSGLMTLGVHTHTHPDLRGLPSDRIATELDRSNQLVRQRCGVEPRHFAYPKGYWDATADTLVRSRYATAVLGAGAPVTEHTDPYLLHRIPVQKSDGGFFFERKMRTGMRWEDFARRRIRGYRGP